MKTFYKDQWGGGWTSRCETLHELVHSVWNECYTDHPIEHHNDPTYNKWIDYSKFANHEEISKTIGAFSSSISFDASIILNGPVEWICKGITRWDPGTRMQPHIDAEPGWEDRELASIVYLNDDFVGGNLYFPHTDFPYSQTTFQPAPGMHLLFPCAGEEFRHGVTEITEGVRYTLSGWLKRSA